MSPNRFNKLKNLYIMYPGATGGNHLQNMVSLCDEFNKLFESKNYELDLLTLYKNVEAKYAVDLKTKLHAKKAHFGQYHNGFDRINFIENNKKNVAAGHSDDYWEGIKYNRIPHLYDSMWIVVAFPKKNSIPYKRALLGGWWPQTPKDYSWPFLHNATIIADDNNGFYMYPELLFTSNGSDYFRNLLIENFGITLPKIADEIHKIWFSWMEDLTI